MAAQSVPQLAERLRNAPDFRVRVQAALALGASNNSQAVTPLCAGLDDSNASVRTAAAAGLERLNLPAALPCLKKRASTETNASVKSQIDRSIQRIENAASGAELSRAPNANTKWYVAVGKTKNKSDRTDAEVDALLQAAMRRSLAANASIAIAPSTESPAQAQALVSKHNLSGYLLQATLEPPKYEDSKLTVTIRITMFSYPNKALQGEFAPKLTQTGTPSKDVASENELIKLAVERAISRFVSVVETSSP